MKKAKVKKAKVKKAIAWCKICGTFASKKSDMSKGSTCPCGRSHMWTDNFPEPHSESTFASN
jgi:hypothetical protein